MLCTSPNIADPDSVCEVLVKIQCNLSPERSRFVNAKLILRLANRIDDLAVPRQTLAETRQGVAPAGQVLRAVA